MIALQLKPKNSFISNKSMAEFQFLSYTSIFIFMNQLVDLADNFDLFNSVNGIFTIFHEIQYNFFYEEKNR